jgi:integrase
MTVYQHPTGKWAYTFQHRKKRYQDYGYETMRDARGAEQERRKQLHQPKKPYTGMLFRDLANLYLDYCEGYNTRRAYLNKKYVIENQFLKWSKLLAIEVDQVAIEQHMIQRKEQQSPAAANSDRKILHGMLRWGIDRGYIEHNPCGRVRRMPLPPAKKKYIPPPADIAAVLLKASPVRRDMIELQRLLVARGIEIARLRREDVDLKQRLIKLWSHKSSDGNAKSRTLWLNDDALRILTRRLGGRRDKNPLVFPAPDGEPYSDRHWLRDLCVKAGIKVFGTHALRHYGASKLLESRTNPKIIQMILGHEQFSTTEGYLHLLGGSDEMIKAMQQLEAVKPDKQKKKPEKSK